MYIFFIEIFGQKKFRWKIDFKKVSTKIKFLENFSMKIKGAEFCLMCMRVERVEITPCSQGGSVLTYIGVWKTDGS